MTRKKPRLMTSKRISARSRVISSHPRRKERRRSKIYSARKRICSPCVVRRSRMKKLCRPILDKVPCRSNTSSSKQGSTRIMRSGARKSFKMQKHSLRSRTRWSTTLRLSRPHSNFRDTRARWWRKRSNAVSQTSRSWRGCYWRHPWDRPLLR